MMSWCNDCRFWDEFSRDETNLAHGFCCRYAPRPIIKTINSLWGDDSQENVEWPVTRNNQGCGEFEKPPMDIQP